MVLLKLLPIFCDLLGAMLAYRFSEKRLGQRAALLLCAFYAFNPAVLVDSAAWGQIDSVLTLLVAICAVRMSEGGYISSLAAFALAVLVKPQVLLFAPVGLAALVVHAASFYERKPRRPLTLQERLSLAAAKGGKPLPESKNGKEARRCLRRLFWQNLVSPHFWAERLKPCLRVLQPAPSACGTCGASATASCGRSRALPWRSSSSGAYRCPSATRASRGWAASSARPSGGCGRSSLAPTQGYRYMTVNTLNLYAALGQNWLKLEEAGFWPYIAWGLFALSYVFAILLQLFSKDGRKVFLTGAVLIVLVCTFGPMMHERYVYPAAILLLLAYADCRDRRLLWSTLVLTVTLFMNEALVLQGGMTELNYGHLSSSRNG